MPKRRSRVFSRAFKLAAVRRMLAGEDVSALSRELQVSARISITGERGFVRAVRRLSAARVGHARLKCSYGSRRMRQETWRQRASGSPRWNARSASNRFNSIFFDKPCGESGEHASETPSLAHHALHGHPNDDDLAAARRTDDCADVLSGWGEPRWILPQLGSFGAAPGGDRGTRYGPACGAGSEALWLSAGRRRAAASGRCREP